MTGTVTALDPDLEPVVLRTVEGEPVAPPGAPFVATLHRDATVVASGGSYRIVLLIEGRARVSTSAADVDLRPGTAAVLPAAIETVAAYLASQAGAGRKVSTITRRAAAISYAHRLRGLASPTAAEPIKDEVKRALERALAATG